MVARTIDGRYLAVSAAAAVATLVGLGLVTAIVPNPVFGRQIPPEPFAIATWIASSVLAGLVIGTYLVPARPDAAATVPVPLGAQNGLGAPNGLGSSFASGSPSPAIAPLDASAEGRSSFLGYAGGFAAFLAIGCPVCNKAALVLLGWSGALSIWAPLQPIVGVASLGLLAATLAWRLRLRARGGACRVA
jgi:hypothetical protein